MKSVLVTGSNGFIGKNLISILKQVSDVKVFEFDIGNTKDDLREALGQSDVIFHLAGVNRPKDTSEFVTENVGLTEAICEYLKEIHRNPRIVFTSSIQAAYANPYGESKKAAEAVLQNLCETTGAEVVVYRLPGVFGKWSRPNYNTVVATFCHNIARDIPIKINDASSEVNLVYIDDVVAAFVSEIYLDKQSELFLYRELTPSYSISLGKLAQMLNGFKESRQSLHVPTMDEPLVSKMYSTYLSYLPVDDFAYNLTARSDQRGSLAEFVKSPTIGQMFISRTKPGITRGDHYHHSKVEKFLVVEGQGIIRFRSILGGDVLEYPVDGRDFRVVDIPPGYTHSIENVGAGEMVVLFWAGEIFNPENTDTIYLPVVE